MARPRPDLATAFLAALGAGYIWLIRRTTRWTVEGREAARLDDPGGVILATWHGRLFLAPTYVPGGKPSLAMISRSRDGDLFAGVMAHWGVGALRGSTHDPAKRRAKGGGTAFRQALHALAGGALVGITPDGPRGPGGQAQPGAARLAIAAGVPVVAAAFSVCWGRRLAGWDRFLLPFPFGRGAIVYGLPRRPAEGDGEGFTKLLEADLNAVTARADALCGRAP